MNFVYIIIQLYNCTKGEGVLDPPWIHPRFTTQTVPYHFNVFRNLKVLDCDDSETPLHSAVFVGGIVSDVTGACAGGGFAADVCIRCVGIVRSRLSAANYLCEAWRIGFRLVRCRGAVNLSRRVWLQGVVVTIARWQQLNLSNRRFSSPPPAFF